MSEKIYSNINIYETKIDPTRNMVIDNIDDYLSTLTPKYTANEFQYIKTALDVKIKIDADSFGEKVVKYGDYVVINNTKDVIDDTTHTIVGRYTEKCYYFIMELDWVSTNTVNLLLALDTLNTYKSEIFSNLTNKTHITRTHKDRFSAKNSGRLLRKIDNIDEGLNPVKYKTSSYEIESKGNNDHWYLVYKSDTNDEDSPIRCYCYVEENNQVKYAEGQTEGTKTWTSSSPEADGNWYYFLWDKTDTQQVHIRGTNTGDLNMTLSSTSPYIGIHYRGDPFNWEAKIGNNFQTLTGNPQILYSKKYYRSSNWYDNPELIKDNCAEISYLAGTTGDRYISGIENLDRADSRLVKIIELPYAPFNVVYQNGLLVIPDGWSYDTNTGSLSTNDKFVEFLNSNFEPAGYLDTMFYYIHTISNTEVPQINAESKLYNSEFYTNKFVYDNNSLEIKNELFSGIPLDLDNEPKINVHFKPSNNISSALGFNFSFSHYPNIKYAEEQDYGLYLLSQRDNESPIYNSAWLTYSKYSGARQADKTSNALSGASSLIGVASSTASAALMAALTPTKAGKIAALVVTAIASTVNASISIASSVKSQRAKEEALKAQAASASGINDLNMLNYYNGNKLLCFRYSCNDNIKNQIWQYFRLYGYATNEYAIPNITSRYWYNFVQCEPVFNGNQKISEKFMDDIKARITAGFTTYHKQNNTWDLDQQYENWETSLQ